MKKTFSVLGLLLVFLLVCSFGVSAGILDAGNPSNFRGNLPEAIPSALFNDEYAPNVQWPGTFNQQNNNNVFSVGLPHDPDRVYHSWITEKCVGNGQITIVDGYAYTYDGTSYAMGEITHTGSDLWKIDLNTGKVVDKITLSITCGYNYAYTCYGEGKIFIAGGDGLAAVDTETFKVLWQKSDGVGNYPCIQYHDGYLFAQNKVYKASDGEPVRTLEGISSYAGGALVTNNEGHDIFYVAAQTGAIYAYDTDSNWSTVDSYTFKTKNTGGIQPGVVYGADENRLYWADAMTPQVYSIALNKSEKGIFDDSSFLSVKPVSGSTTTCTPVVFNGRIYVGGQGSNGGTVDVLDSKTLSEFYFAKGAPTKIQSTPLLDTSEFLSGGNVYLIAQAYSGGNLYVLEDSPGQASGELKKLAEPAASGFSYEQLACDENGNVYYMTDAGYLMKLSTAKAFLNDVQLKGTANDVQVTLQKGVTEYTLPTSASATSVTVHYTLPEDITATLNGETSLTGGTVSLNEGIGIAEIVVSNTKDPTDTRTYTFTFKPDTESAQLKSLIVSNTGSWDEQYLLPLTPSFDPAVENYVAEVGQRKNVYFQAVASSEDAEITVTPVTSVGNSNLTEDGNVPSTKYNGMAYYRIDYADGMSYAVCDINVSSLGGATSKTYRLTMQRAETFAVTPSESEYGTITPDRNSLRGAVGDTINFTAVPAEGYELTKLTAIGESGVKTAVVRGAEDHSYSFTMPSEPVTVEAVWAETETAVRSYNVVYDLTGLTPVGGVSEINSGSDLVVSLTADQSHVIPADLHVYMDGSALTLGSDYTLTPAGTLMVPGVSGDVQLVADDYSVTSRLDYMALSGSETVQGFTEYKGMITTQDDIVAIPEYLKVSAGDQTLIAGEDYLYDNISGELTVFASVVGGDLVIDYAYGEDFVVDEQGYLSQYNGSGGDVVIPMGVTRLASSLFSNRSDITSVTLPKTLTNLNNAFRNCTGLTKVVCSDKLEIINSYAFDGCTSLTEIDLGNGVKKLGQYAFQNCSSLKHLYLPDSLTTIDSLSLQNCGIESIRLPEGALSSLPREIFKNDVNLKSVVIPDNIGVLGDGAFSGCTSLTDVTFSSRMTTIPNFCFSDCTALASISLPENIKTVGNNAFVFCESLTDVDLGNVTTLGVAPFSYCSALETLHFPKTITSFGGFTGFELTSLTDYTVEDGSDLLSADDGILFSADKKTLISYPLGKTADSYVVPETVTEIGAEAFQDNAVLTSVTLPSSLKTIGGNAFKKCAALTEITIPGSVSNIGGSAFSFCDELQRVEFETSETELTLGSGIFTFCEKLTSVTLPQNLTSIAQAMFNNCSALSVIDIPDTVTVINKDAFRGCKTLTEVTIPENVTELGQYAFNYCLELTKVNIPDSVTTMGPAVFYQCGKLEKISIPGSVKVIPQQAFHSCTSLTEVTLAEGIETIDATAFSTCAGLTHLTVPASVTKINRSALNSVNLASVTFLNPGNISIADPANTIGAATTVMKGYTGSGAQAFAVKYNKTFEPLDTVVSVAPEVANGAAAAKLSAVPAAGNYGYTLDCRSGDASVTSSALTIEQNLVSQITVGKLLIVKTDLGEFTFDENALALMKGASGGITFKAAWEKDNFTNKYAAEYPNSRVYELSLVDGNGTALLSPEKTRDKNVNIQVKYATSDSAAQDKSIGTLNVGGKMTKLDTTFGKGSVYDSADISNYYISDLNCIGTTLLLSKSTEPAITGDLSTGEVIYGINDTAAPLIIAAEALDNGKLSYQWYRNTAADAKNGVAIEGATEASYVPSTSEIGTAYYYVVVTNTANGTEATTVSAVTPVTVKEFDGYVYFTVERTTVGQGLVAEPMKVGYWETDTLAAITERAVANGLGYGKTIHSGTVSAGYYLSGIKDGGEPEGWAKEMIPEKLQAAGGGDYNEREKADTLSNLDYSATSGWYFGVDNVSIALGADSILYNANGSSDQAYTDGSVIRLCFTYYGLGQDCFNSGDSYGYNTFDLANRDLLIKVMTDADKSSDAYVNALAILSDWNATQQQVDSATLALGGTPAVKNVVFYSENGETVLDTVTVAYGEEAIYSKDLPLKESTAEYTYVFDGWVTEPGSTEKADLSGVTANMKVYASFKSESVAAAAAAEVEKLIAALPDNVTEENKAAVETARNAYEALSEEGKALVSNADKLIAAEEALKNSESGEAAAAAEVEKLIAALPDDVTAENKNAVEAARNAYEALSEEGKALVSNVDKLIAAEEALKNSEPSFFFRDVQASDWYYNDVAYMVKKSIMNGMEVDFFGADESITRGQFVAVIGRYMGVVDASSSVPVDTGFSDVNSNSYYAAHIAWAAENNIVNGVGDGKFAPDAKITREDMSVLCDRFAKFADISLTDGASEAMFADDALISDYAKSAVYNMKASGIINGMPDGNFRPRDNATRAQAAKILHLLLEYK